MMKKGFILCLVCICFMAAQAMADAGTVANRLSVGAATIEADLAYVQKAKAAGALDANDPVYRRVQDYFAAKYAAAGHSGRALDQGNDYCPATIIPSLPYFDSGSTVGQTDDFHCAGNLAPDVVYQYTAVADGIHEFSTCGAGTNYDTRLEILHGACPGGAQLACNDDFCGLQSFISLNLTTGQTVTIVVDGYFSNEGAYALLVTGPSAGSCFADFAFTAPVQLYHNSCGMVDNCDLTGGAEDVIFEITIPNDGEWKFSLCDDDAAFWDSYLAIGTTCCSQDVFGIDDGGCPSPNYYLSQTPYLALAAGVYYVTVEGLYSGQCGQYTLTIEENTPPPPGPNVLRVISVPVPSSIGVSIAADCHGDLYYTNFGEGILYKMDAFGTLISSTPMVDANGTQIFLDELSWDEGRQLFWAGELNTNAIWTVDRNGLAIYQFPGMGGVTLTDGLAFDPTDGTIWHSTDVSGEITHFSATGLLLGTLIPLDENGNPEGSISGVVVGVNNTLFAGHSAIDDVRRVDKTTGSFISRFDAGQVRCEGMECDAINFAPLTALWVKDAYNNTVTAFEIEVGTCVCSQLPDTCQFPYELVDMGDLPACNYPTLFENPGHALSGIAWLGQSVTGEPSPNSLDLDPADDGVFFINLPWEPCTMEQVRVVITAGPQYDHFAACNGHLYLSAWKDGNLDGDFCDDIPCGEMMASEWIIQDFPVVPGQVTFTVLDPGVQNMGVYDGVFRFRLSSQPVGRYGFGQAATACPEQCGTFAFDILGEVEDYIIDDGQLAVELAGFEAIGRTGSIALRWTTRSETSNDRFEIIRDGALVQSVASAGNTATGHSYEWVDAAVEAGRSYGYALVAVDANGHREQLATAVASVNPAGAMVTEYALHQNYPNPFNPETRISFDLVERGDVSLRVFNLVGQEVAVLVNGTRDAGRHTVSFNAANLPSGLYLYKLEANGFSASQKMMLMK